MTMMRPIQLVVMYVYFKLVDVIVESRVEGRRFILLDQTIAVLILIQLGALFCQAIIGDLVQREEF